jgi:hypothetical protein
MIMVGQSRRLARPLGWTPRDRWIIRIVVLVTVIAAAAIGVVAIVQGGTTLGPGCISVTTASTTGGVTAHACGSQARALCRSAESLARAAQARSAFEMSCRKAGLPLSTQTPTR